MSDAKFVPPPLGNGPLKALCENVWVVGGLFKLPLPFTCITRNMIVLREKDELALVGCVRLDEATEAELLKLGKIVHVIALCHSHGCDDTYYVEKFGATYWNNARMKHPNENLKGKNFMESTPFQNMQFYELLCVINPAKPTNSENVLVWKPRADSPGILVCMDILQGEGPPNEDTFDCEGAPATMLAKVISYFMGFTIHGTPGVFFSLVARPNCMEDYGKDLDAIEAMDFDMAAVGHGLCFSRNAKKIIEQMRQKHLPAA
ncbi:hypothetical protein FVE85_1890 [Porphyridium purpureum]|uniref:Metallo-beta-lactamase domain-containing protein n=1 Tax=Porphyridium purpureum TaxID=35688 RepID=A0A5J4YX24_PORPP|nr:hypothetical protein FVE85_1890 [Porphyridium purpureum]|eukprot:POR4049..scf209_3